MQWKNIFSMKHLLIRVCILFLFYSGAHETYRFVVVSNLSVAYEFYHRIQNSRSNFHNASDEIDINTKREICADITGSILFRKYRLYEKRVNSLSRLIERFNYPTQCIQVRMSKSSATRYKEVAFACRVRQVGCRKKEYYISQEYNLNIETSESYAAGRFIFKKRRGHRRSLFLYGLAESSGKAYLSPDHNMERLYLQRRKNYGLSWEVEGDTICKLNSEERFRICIAAFNSDYFEGKITFSNSKKILPSCSLRSVSFQTEYGKKKAGKGMIYNAERMLDCNEGNGNNLNYLISHAYESNQIFVFYQDGQTKKIFPENLIFNIRLTFTPAPNHSDPIINNYTSDESAEFGFPFPFQPSTFGISD